MTAPLDLDALSAALAKATTVNGQDWHLPWRVIPSDGKPTIAGARSGNLFRGYIATWDEADLIVTLVNAAPQMIAEITALREERGRLQEALENERNRMRAAQHNENLSELNRHGAHQSACAIERVLTALNPEGAAS